MTFVTTLRLESGDRRALDAVVDDIRSTAERKGAEFKGPHTPPPEEYSVPLHKTAEGDEQFPAWSYTVYSREVEIVGHDEFARSITTREFPESIHVEAEVRSVQPSGT